MDKYIENLKQMASSVMISTNHAEKGLTLLEILVVLAIIGIVAAISVPNI